MAQYDSLFNKLLKLPDDTLVYPAHDYKGDTVSTIAEERAFNTRLQVASRDEYIDLMNNLNLPNPKMMDVAVPVNLRVGLHQDEVEARGWTLTCDEMAVLLGEPDIILVDLREAVERERHGEIPDSLHAPYVELQESVAPGGLLRVLAEATGKRLVFYCAYGERSAMAVQCAQEAGLKRACHIKGGLDAWRKTGGPIAGASD